MDDRLDLLLTGFIPAILIVAVSLTLLLSLLLLHSYRRAVVRSMGRDAGGRNAGSHNTGSRDAGGYAFGALQPPSSKDSEEVSSKDSGQSGAIAAAAKSSSNRVINRDLSPADKATLYARLLEAPWRQAAIYGMGGLGYAMVMSLALHLSFQMQILPVRFLCILWLYLWPTLIIFNLVAASTKRILSRSLIAYFVGLVGWGLLADSASVLTFNWTEILILWMTFNLPATVLLLAFLHPQIRAVGPLVLTGTLFVVTGFLSFLFLISSQDLFLKGVVILGTALGQNHFFLFLAIGFVLSLVVVAPIVWGLLRWIRRSYEQKRISEQGLLLVAIGLFFGLAHSIGLASMSGSGWVVIGAIAFAVFVGVSRVLMTRARSQLKRSTQGVNLLLLRVFALGQRSDQLFQSLSLHWRHIGSIQMIAGPDLLNTTIEPHEFLDFVTGKLARRFIDSPQTLAQRLKERDLEPDLDRRFRVNDFFCYNDTWRLALLSLLETSDVVLMDLRSFSQQRAGCIFEINTLIHGVPVEQVVLLVDDTTDTAFLQKTIQTAWHSQPATSPNILKSADALKTFSWERGLQSLPALFQVLLRTT
ncbi:MAG: hypothetical protein AAFV90_09175 [Cyanobacteria bacterium J06634_5]